MGRKITFRADASGEIGFGHLRRCLTLAEAAAKRGHEVAFLLSDLSDGVAADLLKGAAGRIDRIGGQGRPGGEIAALQNSRLAASDALISDCAHSRVLAERHRLPELLRCLHEATNRLVVIEGLGGDSLVSECDGIADLLVTPYAVAGTTQARPRRTRQLVGAEFAILAPDYGRQDGRARAIAPEAGRILVTTGGADPAEVALLIVAACEQVGPAPLELHIVIGPFFSPSLRRALAAAAERSDHAVSLIEAPENLLTEMLWCDLAVSTSGLTKYELAATGTPTVMLSHDAAHAKNNEAFAALGTTLDLGELSELSRAAVAQAVSGLLQDPAAREEMSLRGRAAVDGAGVERIIDVIEEMTA
jgi:spore coat polysaccharide biosynthesis predicted glycosyltransferase SpsG